MTTATQTSRPCGTDDNQDLIYQSHESSKSELQEHWYKHWLFVGHSSQIPASGDYITLQVGHYPVILTRNNDGDVVALNNSCRHRGSRVCQQDKGHTPNLVCPYHQWTYNLDGELVFARNMMDEIDLNAYPMKKFAVAEYQGFIFINLTDEAATVDISAELSAVLSGLAAPLSGELNSAAEYRQKVEAHWSEAELFSHSNAECLHQGRNLSIWQTEDHLAIIRKLPLNLYQTEIAIQCLVPASAEAYRDYLDQALLEEWGVTDYQSATATATKAESDTAKSTSSPAASDENKNLIYQSHESSKSELKEEWYKHWLFIGHSSQIPANGDYITLQIGHYPVILVRNNEGEITALNNSCRHRGSRVCQQDKGNAPNLVCPYHQWTYDLNGELVFARNMMDEIDLNAYPMKKFAVAEYQGFIYINLTDRKATVDMATELSGVLSELATPLNGELNSAVEYRQLVEAHWSEAELFSHASAQCLHQGHNMSIWQAEDHLAVIRKVPLNLYQTELAIQCLVPASAEAYRDYLDQALLEEWGVTDYQPTAPVVTDAEADPVEQHQANVEFAEKYGLEAPVLRHDEMDYNDMFSEHQIWDSSTQELECTMVVDETHNVKTYTFKAERNSWFKYKPGQFITLALPAEDGPVLRTYTISSTPSRPFSLSVTVKLQPDSTGTRWLFENVHPGTKLKAYGPAGEFTFFNQPTDKYLFISAGSGITPMMSMTRWMFDYGYDMDVNFISCVNSPEDIIYREELETIAGRCPNFLLSWVCANDTKYNAWTGLRGRFNKLILGLTAPDYMDRDVYCCGPAPFMKAVRDALDASGFDMSRYFDESFGAPEGSEQEDQYPDGGEVVQVNFGVSDKSREINQRETLLEAAKAANIAIPSACGFGVCGTCKVKVVSGETHMVHSGGISQKEIDEGYVLACCTNPITDTEIAL